MIIDGNQKNRRKVCLSDGFGDTNPSKNINIENPISEEAQCDAKIYPVRDVGCPNSPAKGSYFCENHKNKSISHNDSYQGYNNKCILLFLISLLLIDYRAS